MSDDSVRPSLHEVRIPGSAQPPAPPPAPAQAPMVTAGLGARYVGRVLTNLVPVVLMSAAFLVYGSFGGPTSFLAVVAFVGAVAWVGWQCQRVGASGANQARRIAGVAVVDQTSGQPIGFGRSLARELVPGLLSAITCGIFAIVDAIMALAHPERLSAHDRMFKTRVIRLDSVPARRVASVPAAPTAPVALPSAPGPSAPPLPPGPSAGGWAPPRSTGVVASAPGLPAVQPAPAPVPAPSSLESATRFRPPIEVPAVAAPAALGHPVLVIDGGQRIEVPRTVLVGRNPAAGAAPDGVDLVAIPDPSMSLSKTHAAFGVGDDGSLWVEDRASTNGVALVLGGHEQPVTPNQRTPVPPGASLRLGDRTVGVELPGPGSSAAGGVVPIDGMPSNF